jgi:hypothetical protein
MLKTWKFAVTTPQGIYQGELEGEQEPGETDVQAMQSASTIARKYVQSYEPDAIILACFVSDSSLLIDAPDATMIKLNIEEELQR